MKGYQLDFAAMHKDVYFDIENRKKKANKMLNVIRDVAGDNLSDKRALDVGCSTGVMSKILSEHFGRVTGIDIDAQAVAHAKTSFPIESIDFQVADAMQTGLAAGSFDVVICAHVYEHVPDPHRMMSEIHRVLRVGGICYFAAENKFVFREGDYRLPFLSILPKPIAHLYLRLLGRGTHYYETLFTYWQLKHLVRHFETVDFTKRIIDDPARFGASDLIASGSIQQRAAQMLLRLAYWLFPTYIWVLRKQTSTVESTAHR